MFFLLTWMLLLANIQYRLKDKFVCEVYNSSCKRKWFHQQLEPWEWTTHDGGTSTAIWFGLLSITRRDYFRNTNFNLGKMMPSTTFCSPWSDYPIFLCLFSNGTACSDYTILLCSSTKIAVTLFVCQIATGRHLCLHKYQAASKHIPHLVFSV